VCEHNGRQVWRDREARVALVSVRMHRVPRVLLPRGDPEFFLVEPVGGATHRRISSVAAGYAESTNLRHQWTERAGTRSNLLHPRWSARGPAGAKSRGFVGTLVRACARTIRRVDPRQARGPHQDRCLPQVLLTL